MKNSIRLSKKHGLNPSLMQCFVCMEDVGVALLGQMKNDAEAPRRICLDHEPCDKCQAHMEQGIVLISVDENQSSDMQNPYRTGGWCVVREDFVQRVFSPPELVEQVLRKRMAFLPDDAWDMIGLPR